MCGRFTLTSTPEALAQRFGLEEPPQLAPRYNVAPGQNVLAVRVDAERKRRVAVSLRWGLVPAWAEDPAVGYRMINARAETAAQKPAFRSAFRARRCLVPADGFYEWAKREGGKQPFHIRLQDGAPFGIAALWERWRDPAGGELESCTLLTTDASRSLREIHPRMPVILDASDHATWLAPDVCDPELLQPLLRPYPDAALAFHPVSQRVNSARIDDPECMAPVPEAARQDSLF